MLEAPAGRHERRAVGLTRVHASGHPCALTNCGEPVASVREDGPFLARPIRATQPDNASSPTGEAGEVNQRSGGTIFG